MLDVVVEEWMMWWRARSKEEDVGFISANTVVAGLLYLRVSRGVFCLIARYLNIVSQRA